MDVEGRALQKVKLNLFSYNMYPILCRLVATQFSVVCATRRHVNDTLYTLPTRKVSQRRFRAKLYKVKDRVAVHLRGTHAGHARGRYDGRIFPNSISLT